MRGRSCHRDDKFMGKRPDEKKHDELERSCLAGIGRRQASHRKIIGTVGSSITTRPAAFKPSAEGLIVLPQTRLSIKGPPRCLQSGHTVRSGGSTSRVSNRVKD